MEPCQAETEKETARGVIPCDPYGFRSIYEKSSYFVVPQSQQTGLKLMAIFDGYLQFR